MWLPTQTIWLTIFNRSFGRFFTLREGPDICQLKRESCKDFKVGGGGKQLQTMSIL